MAMATGESDYAHPPLSLFPAPSPGRTSAVDAGSLSYSAPEVLGIRDTDEDDTFTLCDEAVDDDASDYESGGGVGGGGGGVGGGVGGGRNGGGSVPSFTQHTSSSNLDPGHTSYDPASADVWSLGVTLFTMVAGHHPWEEATDNDSRFRRLRRGASVFRTYSSIFPSHLSLPLRDLLQVRERRARGRERRAPGLARATSTPRHPTPPI